MTGNSVEAVNFGRPCEIVKPPPPEIPPALLGYTAVVLGGTSGIGEETAVEFARQGAAHVIIIGTNPDHREHAIQRIQDAGRYYGTRVTGILSDISTEGGVAFAVETIKNLRDPDVEVTYDGQVYTLPGDGLSIDTLVLAAGKTEDEDARRVTWDKYERVHRVNTLGPAMFTIGLKNEGLFAKKSSITGVASIVGPVTPNIGQMKYGGSKAELVAILENWAQEWAKDGIRVNAVCPGFVDTPLTHRMLQEPRVKQGLEEFTPLGRNGIPSDIAPFITFLASDSASFFTGGSYVIDGGLGGEAPAIYKTWKNGWHKLDFDEYQAVKAVRLAAASQEK